MRKIDSFFGNPILWVMGKLYSKDTTTRITDHTPKQAQKVIITKFLGIGSTVLSIPLLQTLKAEGYQIAFWSFEGPAELIKTLNLANEILVIKPTLLDFIPTLFRTWLQVRRFKAQLFIDLEPTANFTSILAKSSGTKTRIGFQTNKPLREAIFTHLAKLDEQVHMTENFNGLIKSLGIQLAKNNDHSSSSTNTTGETIKILININASELSWQRKWPNENWVTLCHQLLEDRRVELYFSGSITETEAVTQVIKKIQPQERILNLAGKTSIASIIDIISDCQLVITVDSGLMHLASLTKTPIIALFGPESPKLYGPTNIQARSLSKELPCSPCLNAKNNKHSRCKDNQCMKQITPEEVYLACKNQI